MSLQICHLSSLFLKSPQLKTIVTEYITKNPKHLNLHYSNLNISMLSFVPITSYAPHLRQGKDITLFLTSVTFCVLEDLLFIPTVLQPDEDY